MKAMGIQKQEGIDRAPDKGLERQEFECLYRDTRLRLYNLAARILRNPEDAADVVQDVFVRAYVNLPARDRQQADAWLYRVTVNACYDHLRRRRARTVEPLDDAGEVPSPGDGFATVETRRAVEASLAGLSMRYRTALVLRELHGLEIGEVAAAMSVSKATARVLLHRSRSSFQRNFRALSPAGSAGMSAGLAALLPDLPLPASLLAPAALAPASAPIAAAPIGGLLAELAAGLTAKTAALAAAALLATGGMVAHDVLRPQTPTPATGPSMVADGTTELQPSPGEPVVLEPTQRERRTESVHAVAHDQGASRERHTRQPSEQPASSGSAVRQAHRNGSHTVDSTAAAPDDDLARQRSDGSGGSVSVSASRHGEVQEEAASTSRATSSGH